MQHWGLSRRENRGPCIRWNAFAKRGSEAFPIIDGFGRLLDRWLDAPPACRTLLHGDPRVDNILFLSGVLGTDSTGKLVSGGIAGETRQALENVKAALARNGVGMDRVVKCTVMLADMSEWADMNAVYVTYFTKHLPARSAFGVSGLALGGRVEIECVATVG